MAQISLPEVKLPDIKLPDGFREMNRDDIVQAAKDMRLPKVDLPNKIELPDIDLSNLELPKPIADRLPNRKRANPILPIAGLLAVGAVIAGLWYLITSPVTGPRIKTAVNDLKSRVTGERTELVRYDEEGDLGSLLSDAGDRPKRSSMSSRPYESSSAVPADGTGVPVGPGEAPEGVTSPTH
ncbi:MAG TPA: hypothetical protein VGQ64_11600 [Candidatus Limnocylindrales bacterium]|jgi:hypothetical protein|nr:hypothetical protein [Candidatus Limnocylindrales bacterium]